MNNNEGGIPKYENTPTGEQVMEWIKTKCENAEFVRELKDDEGNTYLFEAQEAGKKEGDFTLYVYHRAGVFGRNQSQTTLIEKVYFEDDMPSGGDIIAEFDDVEGRWVEK